MGERDCPHGWSDCELCLYENPCKLGLYEPEQPNIQEIADQIEKQDMEQVKKDAAALIKENEEREKNLDEHEKFWRDWARTSPPDSLLQKEPINALSGAIKFGGGSNNGRRKQPAKKAPEYLKTWGL